MKGCGFDFHAVELGAVKRKYVMVITKNSTSLDRDFRHKKNLKSNSNIFVQLREYEYMQIEIQICTCDG